MRDESRARWGVVIPAGPGEQEVMRVEDALASIQAIEPDVGCVVIVHDERQHRRDFRSLAGPLADRTIVVVNPRSPDSDWWSEGVLLSIITGLRTIMANAPDVEWVLRMDSDALVIGPLVDAITERFRSDPEVAMLGCYEFECDGSRRDFAATFGKPITRMTLPVSLWKTPRPRLGTSLYGVGKQRLELIRQASANGYVYGEHCQGGAYAIAMDAVRDLERRDLLGCEPFLGARLPEDVVISMYLKVIGRTLATMTAPGEPFGVTHMGLPASPTSLVEQGYGVAHSVKSWDDLDEAAVRAEFRRLREGQAADASA